MKASENPYPSVLLEEQGGDPSTPASGFWKLYPKAGGLYLIDDAGAVTGPFVAAAGGGVTVEDEGTPLATAGTTLDFVGAGVTASGTGAEKTITIPGFTNGAAAKSQSTAGARTVSATTAGTALGGVSDLTLAAVTGDWIEIGVSLRPVTTTAQSLRFDVASIVSAAIVNYVSNGTGTAATTGVSGWFCASAVLSGVGGSVLYQAQAGDLDGGNIVLRLIAWVSASTRDVEAQAAAPLMWWAKNLKQ